MSGGRFNYEDSVLCSDIFGYEISPDYGEEGWRQSKKAAKINPFEDKEISEIIYDVFCLIHSFDWYRSGDTGEDDYLRDVEHFKNKWFGKTSKERIEKYTNQAIEDFKNEISKTFIY